MIHKDFNPDNLTGDLKTWWDGWHGRANKATSALIKKWETTGKVSSDDFDSKLWSELKNFLLDHVFDGKCAYCEVDIGQARQPGDADHFRPKGGVNYKESTEQGSKSYLRARADDHRSNPSVEIDHPGYFWLAYHWKNLLPACKNCNSGKGKKEQFPIRAEKYRFVHRLSSGEEALKSRAVQSNSDSELCFLDPEDLDAFEQPLLLHPYFGDSPTNHIEFDVAGQVRAKKINGEDSNLGKHSIAAYDLWDENLRQARQDAQQKAYSIFAAAMNYFVLVEDLNPEKARNRAKRKGKIKRILKGKSPFSAAQIDYLKSLGWI